ncbi:MAG: undecaprenyl/decaprenyl-phosphate alpha-N-acetylglucosaminyl 1-phosphate transferase [Bacteroidales bacterium]|nr:undecaprenyl/decaprenyl-phosphate alpha-N-acetylglucosaminyl 1-phosphate transferase [Bacteroidales bacterium]
MTIVPTLILSLLLTIVLIPLILRVAVKYELYDIPDERRVHVKPIPRIGGIAMAIGVFISILLYGPLDTSMRAYLAGALIIVVISLYDDLKGLNFKVKFAAQIAAAVIAVAYGGVRIDNLGNLLPEGMAISEGVAIFLTIVAIVGVTNAINLADGLDGLAGGICLLCFICIGYLAYLEENVNIVIAATALSGVIFGFLRFNTHPAVLFMGDTGSQLLGFSAGFLSLSLMQGDTALSPLLPLIILGFPILDTIMVMSERIAGGRSPFAADKNHFHHKLISIGFFQAEAVFLIYIIQAFMVVSAYLLRYHSEWLILGLYLVFSSIIITTFYLACNKGWKMPRSHFIDDVVKIHLKKLKESGFFIRIIFKPVEIGVTLLLILLCFVSAHPPVYLSVSSAFAVFIFGLVWFLKRDWSKGLLLLLLYLFIPFMIYLSETNNESWINQMNEMALNVYNLSFFVLGGLGLLVLRVTRRRNGFRVTPMDFLVLFIAMGIFFLPELWEGFRLSAIKTIILFFTYEIIMGESRDKIGAVALSAVIAFSIVAVRGLL